jgi:hypothetical protein
VQIFKEWTSLRKLIKKYHITYDKYKFFRKKKFRDEYINFLVDEVRRIGVEDFGIPLKGDKVHIDHFEELRNIFARTVDNYHVNFENQFSHCSSIMGEVKVYETSFKVPFRFKEDNRFECQLAKVLDKSTLDVPIYTHMLPRKLDRKTYTLVKEGLTMRKFREFIGYNFLRSSRILLDLYSRIRGNKNRFEPVLKEYRKVLGKDPVLSHYFDIDALDNVVTADMMFTFSCILKKYYYNNNKLKMRLA